MATKSWVPTADNSGFGINNLPFGVIRREGESPKPAVRIGEQALELQPLIDTGLLVDSSLPQDVFEGPTLNPFLALGRESWSTVRIRLQELLGEDNREIQDAGMAKQVLVPLSDV